MSAERASGMRAEVIECDVYATRFDGVRLFDLAKAWLIKSEWEGFRIVPFDLGRVNLADTEDSKSLNGPHNDRDKAIAAFCAWAQKIYADNWESVATRAVRTLNQFVPDCK